LNKLIGMLISKLSGCQCFIKDLTGGHMLMKSQNAVLIMMMVMLLLFGACKKAPEVTHAIASRSDASCLSCHQSGINGAPITKHPKYADCLRCHKEAARNKTKGEKESPAQPDVSP
jgi:hypothetical protein